jgi:hypothetical protein
MVSRELLHPELQNPVEQGESGLDALGGHM